MHRFIHRENIKHFKELLERTADEAEHNRILKLLAEEETKTSEIQPDKRSEVVWDSRS